MAKELKIELQTGITSECWTFLCLAMILAHENYMPWFVEKFNNYYVDQKFMFYCESSENVKSYYEEILIPSQVLIKDDLVQTLKEKLDQEEYIIIFCDLFYIEGTFQYQNEHVMHELLIYGYDDEDKSFDYAIFFRGKEQRISFKVINDSFISFLNLFNRSEWIHYDNFPITSFRLRKDFPEKLIDKVEELCQLLEENLETTIKYFCDYKTEFLETIKANFQQAERLDRDILEQFRRILQQFVSENLV